MEGIPLALSHHLYILLLAGPGQSFSTPGTTPTAILALRDRRPGQSEIAPVSLGITASRPAARDRQRRSCRRR